MMNRAEIEAALLSDVKNIINITWSDQPTDRKVVELIAGGIVYLEEIGGGPLDFEHAGLPRTLLFEYVRYARDEALDVFENNYRHMLLEMRHKQRVNQNVESPVET